MQNFHSYVCEVGGRSLIIETSKLAGQADGAVTLRYGDTVVLVTVCIGREPREGIDFLPLTIDYEERLYAAGKIPGGFIRREGRPSSDAILACRLTDRPLRPLLPKGWRRDIQLIVTVLSADQENDPDILSVIGGSAALSLSEVPFDGPVAAIRVGYIDNKLVLNPTMAELESSQLDLVVVSTGKAVVMVEAAAKEVSEEIVTQAIQLGHEANQAVIELQEELRQAYGKPKAEAPVSGVAPEVVSAVRSSLGDRLEPVLGMPEKAAREGALENLRKGLTESLCEQFGQKEIAAAFDGEVRTFVRNSVLEHRRRFDGRRFTEIRPISCEVGLLPRTHGSALFNRGQTQVLTITTLGSVGQEQRLDGLGIEESKRFMHHYNFPPFSSGEVRRMGIPSRREVGHGTLAEKAILPVLPADEEFPYTIRLVSEVLSSSGSTSMASACASSLSLMDAGIPVKKAVAGVAMGLVTDDKGNSAVLTDIEGLEDAYGDMDFKVAGTRDGVTALQMDIKLKGISMDVLQEALGQARDARLAILEIMDRTLSTSRPDLSPYAPRMYKIMINPEKIGTVIGPGGKTIRSIIDETKTTIDIKDDGSVVIGSPDEAMARRAIEIIERLTKEAEVNEIYTGKVSRILSFGAMVEILPGKEGLVHVSELADYRVARVEDEVNIGDEITVKVIGIDSLGRVNLSRRALLEKSPSSRQVFSRDSRPQNPPERRQRDSRPFRRQ